jgi:hypothetical protein
MLANELWPKWQMPLGVQLKSSRVTLLVLGIGKITRVIFHIVVSAMSNPTRTQKISQLARLASLVEVTSLH